MPVLVAQLIGDLGGSVTVSEELSILEGPIGNVRQGLTFELLRKLPLLMHMRSGFLCIKLLDGEAPALGIILSGIFRVTSVPGNGWDCNTGDSIAVC